MAITVRNSTGGMLVMEDCYEIDTELHITYRGALNWAIPEGEERVIHPSELINEARQYMHPQFISVAAAGGAPPLNLHRSDFCGGDGGSLEFTIVVNNGAPCLIHTFVAGIGNGNGNGNGTGNGGGLTTFRKIWNFILRRARS